MLDQVHVQLVGVRGRGDRQHLVVRLIEACLLPEEAQPSPDSVDVDELTVQYCMAYKETIGRELSYHDREYTAKQFIRRCLLDGITRERAEDALQWLVAHYGAKGVPGIRVPAKLETDWFDRIIDARTRIEKQESEDVGRF